MAEILIPKGYTSQICKNERQRSAAGGEVSITALRNSETAKVILVIEDHVDDTQKTAGPFNLRELDVMRDIINDIMWKALIK